MMETMNMNRIFCCALLAGAALIAPEAAAQKAPKSPIQSTITGRTYTGADYDAFVAKEGWIFSADQTKGEGLPDLDGTPSAIEGGAPFSAREFDPATFDPRLYRIERSADPTLPTNYNVGDRGVIQFHSPQRCQDLYARQLARKSKEQ